MKSLGIVGADSACSKATFPMRLRLAPVLEDEVSG